MPFSNLIPNVTDFPPEYFSGADVKLYAGAREIIDVTSISYQVTEPRLPIFGYASRVYDDISIGTRLVAGQILVPYTGPEGLIGRILPEEPPSVTTSTPIPSMTSRSALRHYAEKQQELIWGSAKASVQQEPFFDTHLLSIHIRFADNPQKDRVLIDVHLESMGGATDPSGQPVFEQYAFRAKDMSKPKRKVSQIVLTSHSEP